MQDMNISSRDFVNSLARGLDVLRTFSNDSQAMTLSEVANKANMSRAGARRLLLTLVELGYACKDGRLFRLTPRYLALGQSSMSAIPLSEVADRSVEMLAHELGACVSLAIRDGDELVQIASASSTEATIATQRAGTRRVLYNTIAGRIFLALGNNAEHIVLPNAIARGGELQIDQRAEYRREMQEIRERGYLVSRPGESGADISVLLPVLGAASHNVVAVLTASSWRHLGEHQMMSEWLPLMRSVSNRILEASLR